MRFLLKMFWLMTGTYIASKEADMYGTCKNCGCTDNNACVVPGEENCHWVNEEHDLCSHCVTAFLSVKGRLIGTLHSKQEWINRVPDILPRLPKHESLLFVDSNHNILTIGKDFAVAEENDSYPVRIYHLVRCESAYSKESIEGIIFPASEIQVPELKKQFRASHFEDRILITSTLNPEKSFEFKLRERKRIKIEYQGWIETLENALNYYECCGILILFGIDPPSFDSFILKLKK